MGEKIVNGDRKYLLVGLGGSGGKVITKLYERLIQERGEGFKSNVTCVAIDTDQEELGKLAELGVKKVCISGSGTVGNMVNILGEDINDWCPRTQNEGPFYSSHVFNGASQCRLKSRLCFAGFLKNSNNELKDVLEDFLRISSTSGSEEAPPLVYIVSSIAGGTGSGIFIQTAFYIKQFFQNTNLHPTVYGLFACPDLYKDVVTPQQLPSLYANAYAVIRELNAFNLICGDEMDAPWGGKVTLDVELSTKSEGKLFRKNAKGRYGDKPYDVLYFIDRINYLSNILGGLDAYYEAMGDIAYSHLYSEISGAVLSNESNEMNAHSIAPCAIYGSAGAATLRYPYEDIMRYFANRSIHESFDSVWSELDVKWRNYLRTKDADAKASGLSKYTPAPGERGEFFCREFAAATSEETMKAQKLGFMRSMVKRNKIDAVSYLFDKVLAEAEEKISKDDRFEAKKKELGLGNIDGIRRAMLQNISGEADGAETEQADSEQSDRFSKIRAMDQKLDDYCEAGLRYAFDSSIELANKILCVDRKLWDVYDNESECSVVKILLQNYENGEGVWVHPVAARHMLYQFRTELKDRQQALLSQGENTPADDLTDFRNKMVASHVANHLKKLADSDESGDVRTNADVLNMLANRWFGKRATHENLVSYFNSLNSAITALEQGFVDALMFFAYERISARLDALIQEYEVFFDNLDEFIKRADAAEKRYANMHEDSSEAIFVCADADIKEALYEEAGKNIDLQTGETASTIAESLFKAMRNKVKLDSKVRRDRKEDIRSTADFFDAVSDMVTEQAKQNAEIQGSVQMNAVQAILREYALRNPEHASDEANYTDNAAAKQRLNAFFTEKFSRLSRMGAPLLQFNVRDQYYAMFHGKDKDGNKIQKPEVTNTYRYIAHNDDCEKQLLELTGGKDGVQEFYTDQAKSLPKDSENQTIATRYIDSASTDSYTILCYSTVHCLQPYQIKAFDEINDGVYYQHYSKRILDMEGLQKYSMTPHMDKRWHKRGAMPYINVSKEQESRCDLAKAFLYALCYGKVGYMEQGSDSWMVFNDLKLNRQNETIYYNGRTIPKHKTNRLFAWLANQEELVQLYASLFDKVVAEEVEKLSRYSDTKDGYKTSITNYARILKQMRVNLFRDLRQTGKSKDSDEEAQAKKEKKTKKQEEAEAKKRYSILRFAWELHLAEENELDKNHAELLVETLCLTIKKYAKAPFNQEAIEEKDETTQAYKDYLEVSRHVANVFLEEFGEFVKKEMNIKPETEAEKKKRLSKSSFGRSAEDLSDEDDAISRPADERALAKTASFEWVKTLLDAGVED